MLSIDNLTTRYGAITALSGVSLRVPRGKAIALIGSNGAGKSTLLNTIAGVIRAAEGRVVCNGTSLMGLSSHRIAHAGVLLVPEGRQILATMTVLENLQLGRMALGKRPPRYGLPEVFALFPRLEERRSQLAGSLSGGEQQMLAIGRAMMGAPEILLLDEPSLGLSPLMVKTVFKTLKQLNDEGLTILLVEQNARRALELADEAYVLERGRIVRHGKSEELRADQDIVAHYLGVAA